jgi:hypothetical protein
MPAMLPVIFAATQLVLTAQDVPQLNVAPSCRAAADSVIRQANRDTEACLRDEQQARDKLQSEWRSFSSAAQSRCLRLAYSGGLPSYVELLTCLELAKTSRQLPGEDRLNGFGGADRR